jgi:hypothetical protein
MRLNCKAILLKDQYGPQNPREFILDELILPSFIEINHGTEQIETIRNNAVFHESGFGYDPAILSVAEGSILEGYFQSPKYFRNSNEILDEIIFPTSDSPSTQDVDAQHLVPPFVAIHVRRGDYLSPETLAFHGIASSSYFQMAIDLMEALHGQKRNIIFTDSAELVQKELSNLRQDWQLFDSDLTFSDLETLRAMSRADNIVMSNSSFSWWAAWKVHSRLGTALYPRIVAPRPWFTNGESAGDLLHPTWITMGG